MENKKLELNEKELEKVNGGFSYDLKGGNLEILLDPNENATTLLQEKLLEGLRVYNMTMTVEDPNGLLMNAARAMDEADKIGLPRKCTVMFTLKGFSKVTINAVETSC